MNPLPRDPLCDVNSNIIGLTYPWPIPSTDDISIIAAFSRQSPASGKEATTLNHSQELRRLGSCGLIQLDRGPCGAFPLSGFAYCTVGQPGGFGGDLRPLYDLRPHLPDNEIHPTDNVALILRREHG